MKHTTMDNLSSSLSHAPYRALYLRVKTAQASGRDCYIHCSVGALVKITPEDDANRSIQEALLVVRDNYEELSFSYQERRKLPTIVLHNNRIDDPDNQNIEERMERLFIEHPPELICGVDELTSLVRQYCGREHWMAYVTYLERLPLTLPRENVLTIRDTSLRERVIPFLEMGEMPHVPLAAKNYLRRSGLSAEEVERLYSRQELNRRKRWGNFTKLTSFEPLSPQIQTLEDLQILASRVKCGPQWSVYCDYLAALPVSTPPGIIEKIVTPLARREELWVQKEAWRTLERVKWKRGEKSL